MNALTAHNNAKCRGRWPGYKLSTAKIRKMANSIIPFEDKVFVDDTYGESSSYAFIPPDTSTNFGGTECSGRFFTSGGCKGNADGTCSHKTKKILNLHDSEMQLIQRCPGTKVYWSAWTPCVSCVEGLLEHKKRMTIYFGRLYLDNRREKYIGNSPLTEIQKKKILKKRAISCLALLSLNNVNIKPWDWQKFATDSSIGDQGRCKNTVDVIQSCKEFQDQKTAMENDIQKALAQAETYSQRKFLSIKKLHYECTRWCTWVQEKGQKTFKRECNAA